MRVHYLEHVPLEGVGNIQNWLDKNNFPTSCTKFHSGDSPIIFPKPEEFDLLIIMGGYMNIYEYDKYPWLRDEKVFIGQAIDSGKKILGICLGAQLLACVLGAEIRKNKYSELGWFPVELTKEALSEKVFKDFPAKADFFHWHGDTFDIPKDSIPIGSSEACKNQGFIYKNNIVGLQFHPEINYELVKDWTEYSASEDQDEIKEDKFIQSVEFMLSQPEKFKDLERLLYKFLDNFCS